MKDDTNQNNNGKICPCLAALSSYWSYAVDRKRVEDTFVCSRYKLPNMCQVLSMEELERKGITKKNVQGALRRSEKLCTKHTERHVLEGTTPRQKKAWDAACARWYHLKKLTSLFDEND